jgi:hypothetical protein
VRTIAFWVIFWVDWTATQYFWFTDYRGQSHTCGVMLILFMMGVFLGVNLPRAHPLDDRKNLFLP